MTAHIDREGDISLIVPCYNAEAFIGEALESALSQTVPPDEILVVDDGSTDASALIVRRFGPKIRYLHQPNSGEPAARNRGIVESRGMFVAFLDADDLWPHDSLEHRLSLLRGRDDVHYVYGVTEQFVSAESRPRHLLQPLVPTPVAGASLFRRTAFEAIGLFDPAIRLGAIMDWHSRARHAGLCGLSTDAVVLRRRIHDGNSVHDADRLRSDYLRALRSAAKRNRAAKP